MARKYLLLLSLLVTIVFTARVLAEGTIGIIVNKDLFPSVQTAVESYAADVEKIEKKSIWLEKDTYTETSTCEAMKADIKTHFDDGGLDGVVLIGDLPIAEYQSDGFYDERDQYVCDLFFMDLDGDWTGSGSVYSGHSGSKEADIWITRLIPSCIESYFDDEVTMINNYLARVQARMYGQDAMERKYVIAGQMSEWGGLEAENQGDMGYETDSIDTYTGDNCGDEWAAALVEGREYGFVYSHSSEKSHVIGFDINDQASMDLDCRFYNSYACSNADYAVANMVTAYAIGDNGLVCTGSSKTGSMIPGSFRAYNKPLGEGKSFGEAFRIWFNEEGLSNVSWHYGMNLQGVGTLVLQKYASGPYLTVTCPDGGEEWEQGKTYEIKWGSNVTGNVKIELLKGGAVEKTLAADNPNNGLFEVEITTDFKVSENYKIRVSSLENDTILNESAEDFTIMEEYIIAAFPYIEKFDDLEKGSVILPRKWEQLSTDDLNWTVWEGKTPSKEEDQGAATGPNGDHTSGTGKYLYVESSGGNNPDKKADYITPKINLNLLKNPELSFWYHMFSDNEGVDEMGDFYLDVSVDGVWKNDIFHIAENQGDQWIEQKIDLTDHRGERVIIRFRGITGSGWASDICIDDFMIDGETEIATVASKIPMAYGLAVHGSRLLYQIPESVSRKQVSVRLYTTQGKLIRTLVDGPVAAGYHSVRLDRAGSGTSQIAAGLYVCRMETKGFTQTIPVLIKE